VVASLLASLAWAADELGVTATVIKIIEILQLAA
jgi:hypothetical protein